MGIRSYLFRNHFPQFLVEKAKNYMSPFCGIVLMYHEVLPDEVNLPAWTVVKESVFRWQMSYLQKNFDIVSIDEALKRINQKNLNIKRPFAVITFDDGYRGNFDIVLPIMELMGLPFTIYVATKAIVEENLYWYDQIINLIYSKKMLG